MGVEESRSEAGLDRSRPASARSPQRDSVETVTTPPARLRLPISPALANTSKWRVTAIREIGKVAAIWTVMAGRARNRPAGADGPDRPAPRHNDAVPACSGLVLCKKAPVM